MEQVFETGRKAEAAGIEALLESKVDAYAILQLKDIDETLDEHFVSFSRLQRRGKTPNIDHYDLVYMGHLPSYTDQSVMLEGLYTKFNIDHPKGFRGHSMSVSDIVALKAAGEVSFHYVDSFGFKELRDFIKPENGLKTSEMDRGKDCVMSDDTRNSNKAPGRERPSVLGQLKELSGSETPRKPFRSHSERGIE